MQEVSNCHCPYSTWNVPNSVCLNFEPSLFQRNVGKLYHLLHLKEPKLHRFIYYSREPQTPNYLILGGYRMRRQECGSSKQAAKLWDHPGSEMVVNLWLEAPKFLFRFISIITKQNLYFHCLKCNEEPNKLLNALPLMKSNRGWKKVTLDG